jgi:hypothetical protein
MSDCIQHGSRKRRREKVARAKERSERGQEWLLASPLERSKRNPVYSLLVERSDRSKGAQLMDHHQRGRRDAIHGLI